MTTKTKYPLLVAALGITVGIGILGPSASPSIFRERHWKTCKPSGGGGTPSQDKPSGGGGAPSKGKPARWEGRVERSSKEQSSLTIRKSGGSVEMTCMYDSSTKWVSQYHADKKVNDIDASEVKDGDYVICTGTADKGGVIHATLISRRLSHSP